MVIVSDATQAMAELKAVSPALAKAVEIPAQQNPRAALRDAGDPDGILPYARARANGKTCATWRGRLSLDKAMQMIAACRQRLTAPPSR